MAIIPCAGFGTRVGMKPHEAKELLPGLDGRPMIDWHLDRCHEVGATPIVLTRIEKEGFNGYMASMGVKTVALPPHNDWPEAVLLSQPYWDGFNALLLPDTTYRPLKALKTLFDMIESSAEFAAGVHSVDDPENWGIVDASKASRNGFIREKPLDWPKGRQAHAWGLLGWRGFARSAKPFEAMLRKEVAHIKLFNTFHLESFRDLTR